MLTTALVIFLHWRVAETFQQAVRWAAIMQQACLLAGILTLNLCTIHVLKLFSMVQRRRYQIWCRPRLQLRRLRWCYLTAT